MIPMRITSAARRGLIGFGVLLVAAAFSPDRARAANGIVQPCSGGSGIFQSLWKPPASSDSRWALAATCPSTIYFAAKSPNSATSTESSWEFPNANYPMAPITAVEFDLSGSDGSDVGAVQEVRVCNASTCGAPVKPDGPSQSADSHHRLTAESGHVPPGATRVVVNGRCELSENCAYGSPLVIRNLVVEIEDLTSPTITVLPSPLNQSVPGLSFTKWINRASRLRLRAADGQSGVHLVQARIGTKWWTLDDIGCGSYTQTANPFPCPRFAIAEHDVGTDGFHINIGLDEGTNAIHAFSQDAVGNRSEPLETSFRVDTFAPQATGLRVASRSMNGWQASRFVDLEWDNGDEVIESERHSGLDRIDIALDSLNSSGTNSGYRSEQSPLNGRFSDLELPSPGWWNIGVVLTDRAGNSSWVHNATVGYDPVTLGQVALTPVSRIGGNELLAGKRIEWSPPQNAADSLSGICGYATSIDQNPTSDPGNYPNVPASAGGVNLPTILLHGTNYFHVRAINCAGVAGELAHTSLDVDSEAPTISISDPDHSGWYSASNSPSVSASDESGEPVEISVKIDGAGTFLGTEGVVAVKLPDGVSTVTVSAVDSSGNVSTLSAKMRSDKTSPAVTIDRSSPDQPNVMRAVALDSASGVRDANFFYRPIGGSWQQLGVSLHEIAPERRAVAIVANIPDQTLPPGRYEIRVSATDHAGNGRGSQISAGSQTAFIDLPLRSSPLITTGFRAWVTKRRCVKRRTRRICRKRRTRSKTETVESMQVKYGKSDRIVGRLVDGAGAPINAASISVFEVVLGEQRRFVGQTSTDLRGRFTFTPVRGTSRLLILRYAGSSQHLPVEDSARLLVRPKLKLSASKRAVRSGGVVKFSGRLYSAGASKPRSGLALKLQFASRDGWRSIPVESNVSRSGRFTVRWIFGRTSRPIKYRIRAVVPWVEGWAYETGTSNVVTVVVR